MNGFTSRRTFLQSAAAIAAGTAASRPFGMAIAQQPEPPAKARITSSVMLWILKGSMEEKLAKAARAGMQSVELVSEDAGWTDAEAERFKNTARSYNLGIDMLLAQSDWTRRPVTMVNPAHREAFLKDVRDAIGRAKRLGASQVILMSGNEQPGLSRDAQYASLVEGAKQAAQIASEQDVQLVLENLNNKVDHKGTFLTSSREALRVVKEVDNPHLRMLLDIYHEYVQNGDPIPVINDAIPYVATFHVADAPGRHAPGTGEMKWADIYKAIGKSGYAGYIAMEYLPQSDEVDSLIRSLTEMRAAVNAASPHGAPAANT